MLFIGKFSWFNHIFKVLSIYFKATGQVSHVTKAICQSNNVLLFLFRKYLAENLVNVSEDNIERLLTSF